MKKETFEIVRSLGGYYQSILLHKFFASGLFDLLAQPRPIKFIAKRLKWQERELGYCLEFLRTTTQLIDQDRNGLFRVKVSAADLRIIQFEVTKFVGAYGPVVTNLGHAPSISGRGGPRVNQKALADAFGGVKDVSRGWIVPMLLGARVSTLVDLGCGTASLLVELAKLKRDFRAIGVEANCYMCKTARSHVQSNRVARRVRIVCADVRNVERLPEAGALHAASLLNEMFTNGTKNVVNFLRRLKARYPGRDCWFVDYYGQLSRRGRRNHHQLTYALLHDLIQVLSGQGVPPPDLKSWRTIYRAAGVKLIEAHPFEAPGMVWFVHRVRL